MPEQRCEACPPDVLQQVLVQFEGSLVDELALVEAQAEPPLAHPSIGVQQHPMQFQWDGP
eukprot:5462657-Heterocapsa_arctica.AAC.1